MSNEELEYLKKIVVGKTVYEIAKLINEKFGTSYTPNQIRRAKDIHKIKSGALSTAKPKHPEHVEYLKKICIGKSNQEIADLMNKKFGTSYTDSAVSTIKYRNKIKGNYRGFVRNNPECLKFVEDNYDTKPLKEIANEIEKRYGIKLTPSAIRAYRYRYNMSVKGKDTRMKKGDVSPAKKPLGSEYVAAGNGETYIKVAEPDVWIRKKKYIYEQTYGKLPDGYDIIFLNGDKSDFRIENLAAIERKDTLIMKNAHLFSSDAELTKIGILTAKITNKRSELTRGKKC